MNDLYSVSSKGFDFLILQPDTVGYRKVRAEKADLFQMAHNGLAIQLFADFRMRPSLREVSMDANVKLLS